MNEVKEKLWAVKIKARCWKMLKCSVKLRGIVVQGGNYPWSCQCEQSLSVFSLELCWGCRVQSWLLQKSDSGCIQTLNKRKKKKSQNIYVTRMHIWKGLETERKGDREKERERTSSLPLPVVPAAPVNSPTWRKRTEEERERERGGRDCDMRLEAEGRGKFAGVTEAEK